MMNEINCVKVQATESESNMKILVSIDSRKHLCIDFDPNFLDALLNATAVTVERDWDGVIKNIEEIKVKPNIMIVNSADIAPKKPDTSEKLKALEQYQAKLAAEAEAVNKEISALNNA